MAPARKKKRLQVVESELSASESHENRSSERAPPISILKDTVASFPSVEPLPKTNETEQLNLRRKTFFISGVDTSEENETCIIHHDQMETSNIVDDKMRRLTYIVTPFPHGNLESPLMNCNPGIEMTHSEMEITGIQLQQSKLQDLKPKKRGGRKKKAVPLSQENSKVMEESKTVDYKKENESLLSNAPAVGKAKKRGQKKSASRKDAQVKTLESENGTEISTVKANGRRKKAQDQENEIIPAESNVQKKSVKRGKKKNAD